MNSELSRLHCDICHEEPYPTKGVEFTSMWQAQLRRRTGWEYAAILKVWTVDSPKRETHSTIKLLPLPSMRSSPRGVFPRKIRIDPPPQLNPFQLFRQFSHCCVAFLCHTLAKLVYAIQPVLTIIKRLKIRHQSISQRIYIYIYFFCLFIYFNLKYVFLDLLQCHLHK